MKYTKTVVDKQLREAVFEQIFTNEIQNFVKINDRQMGVIITDLNGHERYCRIGVIVAEEREDMTARKLMESEIKAYEDKQAEKAEKAAKRAEKAEADKARREAKAKEKGE